MRPLKLALVHSYSWPEVRRGGERLVDELTTYLREAGHVVDVFTGTTKESQFRSSAQGRSYKMHIPWAKALEGYGITKVEAFGVRAVLPLLMRRYDAVHAFTPTAALAAVMAGQPTVYTVIGHPRPEPSGERRLQRRALAKAVTWSTEVAALSRSAADSLNQAFGRDAHILPPGVSMQRCPLRSEPRTGPVRLLFSGDLRNPDKGLPMLLAAFDKILRSRPDARLLLSGPGRADWAMREVGPGIRERIAGSVEDLGTGTVDAVPDRYRSAHVMVLPSRDEAFGIVFVESLACGTPVVGGSSGGAEDIITPDVGRLVDYGDVERLASAIDDCIDLSADPATPERCRARAERWDWSLVGPDYEALYASVAGRKRTPGGPLLQAARLRLGARAARSAARPNPW